MPGCSICHGKKEEHEGAMHEYTEIPGDIRPKKTKEEQEGRLPQSVATSSLGRLIILLREKGLLTDEDLMKVIGL